MIRAQKRSKLRKKQDRQKLLLCLIPMLKILMFAYLPMIGLIVAFQDYKPRMMFASPFVGFKNFEVIFANPQITKLLLNAAILNMCYTLSGIIVGVVLALLLFEFASKIFNKLIQVATVLPLFVSWPLIGLFVVSMVGTNGLITSFIETVAGTKIDFYSNAQYWRFIMTAVHIWRVAGMSMIGYLAILLNTNKEVYEAASIDGANRLQKMVLISAVNLAPLILVSLIMACGNLIRSDFSMNFFIIGGKTELYETVDVLESYMYRALMNASNYGNMIAMDVIQGVCSFVLSFGANLVVKRINPDMSIF